MTKIIDMTETTKTAEVVRRYYELVNAGDWDPWCELFAPDVRIDEQLAGHLQGREALRRLVPGFRRNRSFANRPMHIVIEGEQAAVMSHISVRTASGASIEVDVCNYFQVRDGEISYLKNVHDTVPFAAATAAERPRPAGEGRGR